MAVDSIPEPGESIQLGEFLQGEYRHPAVYFLMDEGAVVYVGQTTNLKWRIDQHIQQGVKEFDSVAFAPCCVSRLLEVESHYIREMAPPYNQCGIAKAARREDSYIPDDPPVHDRDGELCVGSLGLSRIMNCERDFAKMLLKGMGKTEVKLVDAFALAMTVRPATEPSSPSGRTRKPRWSAAEKAAARAARTA